MTAINAHRLVYVISDATGETASRALRVALEQFPGEITQEHRISNVRTPAEIAQIVHSAAETGGLVVFTLADEYLRQTAYTAAEEHKVVAIDLLRELIPALATWLGEEPRQVPGHPYDVLYFERLKAYDFASRQDDGKNPGGLPESDVVVLGVSRTGKSPVCRALAEHRVHAANVPIVLEVPLPAQLEQVDPKRVFVLKIASDRLMQLRSSRISSLGAGTSIPYAGRDTVREEMLLVTRLLTQHPDWTGIDVTKASVEEIASTILKLIESRFGKA